MKSAPVQELIALVTADSLLEAPPKIHKTNIVHKMSRPEADTAQDPYIVFGQVTYKPGMRETGLPYWKPVFETTRDDEDGSFVYAVGTKADDENIICTLESYKSKDYLWDVHVKSDAVQENMKTKDIRSGLSHTLLKIREGWFHKELN